MAVSVRNVKFFQTSVSPMSQDFVVATETMRQQLIDQEVQHHRVVANTGQDPGAHSQLLTRLFTSYTAYQKVVLAHSFP